ncbi:Amidophosphoribosyltransferase [Dissostichus eleginoides]|uniref:Amidophosphoribosyltransferase n=1 Tax=Dissostichus eleginoides TaxID=100907 RepID=A0AAD9FGH5_DISEL|nr:Amidophosphoribosyltransferase [Dissostichus eleginoides]
MIVAVQEVRGQKEQCFLSTLRSEPTRCDPRLRRDAADVETLNEASRSVHFMSSNVRDILQQEPLTLDLIETPSKQQPTDSSQNSGET